MLQSQTVISVRGTFLALIQDVELFVTDDVIENDWVALQRWMAVY
ncbi:hypothetical protein CA54_58370 [Symmachiella macrocystis]|uniref:Uncharacterized protein n=1 Tax=Symmachiella macrocystis TaxID=2527985 RepID=A0A5C6B117_9PLAN|nr:hypothetical protein [Symmachiella macrocystis]TWU05149.1 hypothetical protein CA54_58370 [Symmachiella macrocystis]